MSQSYVNVRMDEKMKSEFNDLCVSLGISMSAAFNLFVASSVRNQALSVSLALDPFYSHANMERLLAAKDRMETVGGTKRERTEDVSRNY